MGQMQIDLNGARVAALGERQHPDGERHSTPWWPMAQCVERRRRARCPTFFWSRSRWFQRMALDSQPMLARARGIGEAMMRRGSGRILFIVSAVAGMPMRRHPDYSVQMAALLAGMRVMAMTLGPKVLVNALGVGRHRRPPDCRRSCDAVACLAGTRRHREEIVDTVLFFCDPLNSYTTGQLLSVDGGWSAGYGRNF